MLLLLQPSISLFPLPLNLDSFYGWLDESNATEAILSDFCGEALKGKMFPLPFRMLAPVVRKPRPCGEAPCGYSSEVSGDIQHRHVRDFHLFSNRTSVWVRRPIFM